MSIIAVLTQPTPMVARARRPSGPGRFHIEDDATPETSAVVAAPASIGLHGLLALQEAEGNDVQDRGARRQAGLMLSELSAMQRALLLGDAAGMATSLGRLSSLAHDGAVAHDPRLAAVVRAIAIRAAVESARHAA